MSDNYTKFKRSKRLHNDRRASLRQLSIAKRAGLPISTQNVHRYEKMHALNCGIPTCAACGNPRKFFGEKTWQETKADASFRFSCIEE